MNTPGIPGSKSELRRAARQYRAGLTAHQIARCSTLITRRLLDSEMYAQASVVMSYASIRKNNEIDTGTINNRILSDGKTLVLPRMSGDGSSLELVVTRSLDQLEVNSYQIPEPIGDQYINAKEIDLVLVPMLAGDTSLNRIGYGKGYYDRMLRDFRGVACGLLYERCLHEIIPAEKHDRPLDCIITENRVLAK